MRSQAQQDSVVKAAEVSAQNRRQRSAERRAKAERDAIPHSERPRVWHVDDPTTCVCRVCASEENTNAE